MSLSIFLTGVIGVIRYWEVREMIRVLMSIELIFLGVNIKLVGGSINTDDIMGQIWGMYVLTVAAGESAIGLGLISR